MSLNGVQDPAVLLEETICLDASKLQEAEARYQEHLSDVLQVEVGGMGDVPMMKKDGPKEKQESPMQQASAPSALVSEIANVRLKIQKYLKSTDSTDSLKPVQLVDRLVKLEQENAEFRKTLAQMSSDYQEMLKKLNDLNLKFSKSDSVKSELEKSFVKAVTSVVKNGTAEDDDDIDLFGSDEETEDERRVKEERLEAYENKKAKKTQVVAKSSVVLDVKPWSDETDLKEMETSVRKIESVGLKWGAAKFVPLAYGIKKLQIVAIVEDENCSIDWLQEQIEAVGDLVQSVDIAAFNKL